MAIKGNGYLKTTWAFQERPVASSKLNSWDDRIESSLELIFGLLGQLAGTSNGVFRSTEDDGLKVQALSPVGLSVTINPGYALISSLPFHMSSPLNTADVTPPVTFPRIDLVQARLETWNISVVAGTEAASPVAPSVGVDCIPLAELYLRPGMSSIQDTDDSTNGYVVDVRNFL